MKARIQLIRKHGLDTYVASIEVDGRRVATTTRWSAEAARQWVAAEVTRRVRGSVESN